MLVNKAYKFRIYPNKKQIELINKTIGCSRFVFNFFLSKQMEKDAYWYIVEEMRQNGQLPVNNWKGKFLNKYETVKSLPELKKHYTFLKEVDSIALQKSVENLADSYHRFYKKQNKQPRFKTKKNPVQSYTTKYTNGNIAVIDNYIKLPKLGSVRFAKSREVEGRIISATIRRNPTGKYFVSLASESEVMEFPKTHSVIGCVKKDNPWTWQRNSSKRAMKCLSTTRCLLLWPVTHHSIGVKEIYAPRKALPS
jgi:putative transposase